MVAVTQVDPAGLKDLMAGEAQACVLDVREDWERAAGFIPGSLHIPMQEVPGRLGELEPSAQIIVVCHVGARSQLVAEFLVRQGYRQVANLRGGMDAWEREEHG
jgi:rhodanese-related sulfurtransferase